MRRIAARLTLAGILAESDLGRGVSADLAALDTMAAAGEAFRAAHLARMNRKSRSAKARAKRAATLRRKAREASARAAAQRAAGKRGAARRPSDGVPPWARLLLALPASQAMRRGELDDDEERAGYARVSVRPVLRRELVAHGLAERLDRQPEYDRASGFVPAGAIRFSLTPAGAAAQALERSAAERAMGGEPWPWRGDHGVGGARLALATAARPGP